LVISSIKVSAKAHETCSEVHSCVNWGSK
jgi:hypothetical protein